METKVCKKCGRELPIENFSRDSRTTDGYCRRCKDCHNEDQKESRDKKKSASLLHSEQIKQFTPRELIDELKRRGYRGKLTFLNEISL